MEYNEENMEKLAAAITNDWDHKEIFSFAVSKLREAYFNSKLAFKEDCKSMGM